MALSRTIVASMIALAAFPTVHAQDSYEGIREEGFSSEADLVQSMSPEQQAAVLKQAEIKQQELKKLPPEQVEKLRTQLHAIDSTLYVEKVDPDKLDANKSKSAADTMKDLDTYQQKYSQGKINNGVVKPLGENP